jgi:hypothetical protein
VRIRVSRDEMLQWIGDGVREGFLGLPPENGPIQWPNFILGNILISPTLLASTPETAE